MSPENLIALLHVQRALISALCATHERKSDLEKAFSFYLEQIADRLDTSPALVQAVAEWAAAYRQHFPTSSA